MILLFYELPEYENGPIKFQSFGSWIGWVWVNKILTLEATLTIDMIKLVFEILDTTN